MADVLFLVITVAFFGLTVGLVRLCDKVIGPDADFAGAQGVGDTDDVAPVPVIEPTGASR